MELVSVCHSETLQGAVTAEDHMMKLTCPRALYMANSNTSPPPTTHGKPSLDLRGFSKAARYVALKGKFYWAHRALGHAWSRSRGPDLCLIKNNV